ncbi:Xaa-Pro peptidase family protein [Lentibacillus halophilus]|uniref:Xaa-Pro peptidase family protein n=1 Tax=Lentibacillus halophilus TaxID=295065 RepID=A0ABP3J4C6_9BACI
MTHYIFTEEDIRGRVAICQQKIDDHGFQGLILSSESNLNYYSHFFTHAPWSTFSRPAFLFIPRQGKPVLYVHVFHAPDADVIAKGCDVRRFDSLYGPTAAQIEDVMHQLGMTTGTIGLEKGYEQRIGFEVSRYEALQAHVSNVTFADASSLIWSQRMIKSSKEVACIRKACEATSYALDKTFAAMEEGMTEWDVSRMMQTFMLEGGADYPGFVIITSGEGNYDRISKTATDRVLRDGDFVFVDAGARYHRYWSDFCRTGVVGAVSGKRQEYQQKIHDVTMRTAEIMRPGIPAAEVANACNKEMERAGFRANFECGRLGHGMGLMSTEPPSITLDDDTILESGMIINSTFASKKR